MAGRASERLRLGITLAVLLCAGSASVIAQAPAASPPPSGPGSVSGLWTTFGYKGSARTSPRDRSVKMVDGRVPPLLPWAAALLEQRILSSEKGEPFRTTLAECLPGGVPEMIFGSPYPIQILETPGQVTFLHEMGNHFRVVYLNGKHPADPDPTFMGHSIGRWENGTLVIETVGLNDRTSIDEIGMPHSDQLRVTERYRRTDANTLEIMVNLNDPRTFSQPWDTKVIYKLAGPNIRMIEYVCENNRSARD